MANDKTIVRTRKNKNNPYVMIDKTGIEDDRLSLKAKGLLATLLAKPDDWKIYITQLATTCKDGVDSVKSALKELREFGYVTMERIRDEKGKITHSEWIVYEQPLYDEKIELKPRRDKKSKKAVNQDIPMDESISGFSTNGETTNGKPTDGESNTTNKVFKLNNDLTNNGWLGEATPSQNTPPSHDDALSWNLLKENCERHGIDKVQAFEFYKVWQHYFSDASIPVVISTIRELLQDKWTLKNGKWTEQEYKNMTGLFHHRMKSWREMAVAYEDVDGEKS